MDVFTQARKGRTSQQKMLSIVGLGCTLLLLLSIITFTFTHWAQPAHASTSGVQLGAEVGDDRAFPFVDVQKEARGFVLASDANKPTTLDSNGWPLTDATEVVFDYRPFGAWAPPLDDPQGYQPDVSGTYHLSFTGQADISPFANDPGAVGAFTVTNKVYNAATNTTTAELNMQPGKDLMVLTFTNTKRLPTDTTSTGITNVKIIRPGYAADTTQTFTDVFINSLKPLNLMRVMGWLNSNSSNPDFGAAKNTVDWADRKLPTDATQSEWVGKSKLGVGISWEYIIQLANQTGKDVWINIPIAATNDYVMQLATLLHNTLNPGIHVYFEYDNEVWNSVYWQYAYNRAAAVAEVQAGKSNLNSDGTSDPVTLAQRRYIRQMINFSNIFKSVYGTSAINTTIRPVSCWWEIQPAQFSDQLVWATANYGAVNQYLWGIGFGNYASLLYPNTIDTSSADSIIAGLNASSDYQVQFVQQLRSLANQFNLHLGGYEIGLDFGQDSYNLPVKFAVNRSDPRIKDVVAHHLYNNFNNGVEVGSYSSEVSPYNHFSFWGLTEDAHNLNTLKFQGFYQFQNAPPMLTPTATPTPTPPPGTTTYLSDLNWVSATTGYGTVQKDKSIGGNPITIRGITYLKGIGTHAVSEIHYNLASAYNVFLADVGVDDEASLGSVIFQVFADGNKLYDSGVVTHSTPLAGHVNVNVTGVKDLELLVLDDGDGLTADHADWAGARLIATTGTSGSTPTPISTLTPTPTPISQGTYLSDLNWISATTGYGTIQKDKSISGNSITVRGVVYPKGIGTHAVSEIHYNLAGAYTQFTSTVGVDDEATPHGSVVFQVFGDGNKLFDSGVVTGTSAAQSFTVSVAGVNNLELLVGDAGDGQVADHADWAGAQLVGGTSSTPTPVSTPTPTPTPGSGTYLSNLTWVSATTGYGTIQKDKSVGGNPITIRGVVYSKGIGTHAVSEIHYNLASIYTHFTATIGVDDESIPHGSVIFQVFGDGVKLFDSGVVTSSSAAQSFNVSVAGVRDLELLVLDDGDGLNSDHADWAGAQVQ